MPSLTSSSWSRERHWMMSGSLSGNAPGVIVKNTKSQPTADLPNVGCLTGL